MRQTTQKLQITEDDLQSIFRLKNGPPEQVNWGPRLRLQFRYYEPDDHYEALITKLVTEHTTWLDIGSGRNLFPDNRPLSELLAKRCRLLVGLDPDDTLAENPFVHQKVQDCLEDFDTEQRFDLLTLRMVAEHLPDPQKAVQALVHLSRPGSKIVVYTINKWSPTSIAARLIPFRFHHALKAILWETEEKDTFPVLHLMNSRQALQQHFSAQNCVERHFSYLDDLTTFERFQPLSRLEMNVRWFLRRLGIRYPEYRLLGVYERQ